MRAIMMMLGLVLHASMTYSDIDYGNVWPLKDINNTSHFFHILIEFIHVFRMPAFFMVSGFFGALLFYKKSPKAMVLNRLHRIVYPFIVAILILWPLAVFAFNFSNHMMAGDQNSLKLAFEAVFPEGLVPKNTIHLWFLFYLAIISYLSCLLALGQFDYHTSRIKHCFEIAHKNTFFAIIPLAAITFLTLYYMGSSSAITSGSFVPDLKTLLFYTVYYWYGWALYLSGHLISNFMRHAWLMLALGTIMFLVKIYFDNSESDWAIYFAILANSISIWLYVFASLGLFLRYANSGALVLRYISDSAYWVYLIHLPLIAFIAGLLAGIDISAFMKFLIVLSSSTTICFASYHYAVRNTCIGLFLNGRKYPGGK